MIVASEGPSPKTVCVALQYNWQPWQIFDASRSCGRVIFCGKKSAADPVEGQERLSTAVRMTAVKAANRAPLQTVFEVRRVRFSRHMSKLAAPNGRIGSGT